MLWTGEIGQNGKMKCFALWIVSSVTQRDSGERRVRWNSDLI